MSTDSTNNNENNNSGAPAAPAVAPHLDPLFVSQEVEKLQAQVKADLGLETLNDAQIQKLHERARINLLSKQNRDSNYAENQRLEAENKGLQAQNATLRSLRSTDSRDFRPAITLDQVRRSVGELNFHKMLPEQKIQALGADPASVDHAQLKQLFGKESDSAYANNFSRHQPGRYRVLREIARALKIAA